MLTAFDNARYRKLAHAQESQERIPSSSTTCSVPRSPITPDFTTWAKRVEVRTKGGLKIQVFHSAQLGMEEDIIEQMRQGAEIGQNTDAARMGNYVTGIAVMNGPYFVETLDDVAKLKSSRPS